MRLFKKSRKFSLYSITENGALCDPEIIKIIINVISKEGKVMNVHQGSAHNDPIYLLGEIDENRGEIVIVAWDELDDHIQPRIFVDEDEVNALYEALEADRKGNSWNIAVELNKEFRGM